MADDEVCVLTSEAVPPGPLWDACFRVLQPAEQERARAIRAGNARNEFVTARALLRMSLAEALGQAPEQIGLQAGTHGKPWIAGCEFNVTHAHGRVMVALSRGLAVGIDLEWVDRGVEVMEVMEAHFTAGERRQVREAADAVLGFYEVWTRKEAALKAMGSGLVDDLDAVEVGGARSSVTMPDGAEVYLQQVAAGAGWACSLASVGRPARVRVVSLASKALETFVRGGGLHEG